MIFDDLFKSPPPRLPADPSTGMPMLNPGWYWRVVFNTLSVEVRLMGPNDQFESIKKVKGRYFDALPSEVTPYNIYTTAEQILHEYPAKKERERLAEENRQRFSGNYPPNVLRGN